MLSDKDDHFTWTSSNDFGTQLPTASRFKNLSEHWHESASLLHDSSNKTPSSSIPFLQTHSNRSESRTIKSFVHVHVPVESSDPGPKQRLGKVGRFAWSPTIMSLTTNVTSNFSSNMATTSVKTEKVIVADVLAQKSTEIESSKIFLWIKKLSCKLFRLIKKRRSDPFLNEITIRNINTLSFKYTDSINQCFNGKECICCKNSAEVETFNSQISESTRNTGYF